MKQATIIRGLSSSQAGTEGLPMRGSYGWRARVGFITVASTLETPLYELYMMAPPGIAFVSMALNVRTVTADAIDDARDALANASQEAAAYYLDHLIISGGPLGYLAETGADRSLIQLVEDACQVATTYELTASVEALRVFDARRIAVASPFGRAVNDHIANFFDNAGFEVSAMEGLGLESNPDITRLPLEATYQVARSAWKQNRAVDAIYITCPRWPVAPIIDPLEKDLGVPVVASMQSALWSTLRSLDLRSSIDGYGRLLAEGIGWS